MKKILGLAVTICMIFTLVIGASMTSCGSGNFAEAANYSTGYYKITSDVGLNMRGSASASGKLLITIPYKTTVKVIGVSNGWGKISYKSRIGWISLKYAKHLGKYLTGIYAIKSDVGLNMHENASTSGRLLITIPYKTKIVVTGVKGVWGRVTYASKTGWISLKYTNYISSNTGKTYKKINTSVLSGVKVETIDYTTLKLSWPRAMRANGYYIYRSTSPGGTFSKIKTLSGKNRNSFVNKKLAKNTAYYYKVASFTKSAFKTRIMKSATPAAACGFTGSQGTAIRKVSCTASHTALIKWSDRKSVV